MACLREFVTTCSEAGIQSILRCLLHGKIARRDKRPAAGDGRHGDGRRARGAVSQGGGGDRKDLSRPPRRHPLLMEREKITLNSVVIEIGNRHGQMTTQIHPLVTSRILAYTDTKRIRAMDRARIMDKNQALQNLLSGGDRIHIPGQPVSPRAFHDIRHMTRDRKICIVGIPALEK